ncbi:o-succinylbenzoate synthase [Ornithinimicrobium pratense]|nr:o-succinylbenzoate synthase [Ornithinimicrobium pratense]
MEMQTPFTTSFGTQTHRDLLIVEARSGDRVGYGECVAGGQPFYSEEFTTGCNLMLQEVLLPLLVGREIGHPDEVSEILRPIRRNNMAKAAAEGAVWDLWARHQDVPLASALDDAPRERVEVGLSIGVKETDAELIEAVGTAVDAGYRRVKLKITPGRDLDMLRAVRREFPDVPMMADANSAYTLDDLKLFQAMDDLDLMMIEQPLAHDDIVDHRHLQAQISTPVCLDESVHSIDDARHAIELESCQIINIKIGRVGGLTDAKRVEALCREHGVDVWCGGMLETGVGRAHNVAIAASAGFTLPGDTAPSARYWAEDVIEPEVTMDRGYITVPSGPGLGYTVRGDRLDALTTSSFTIDQDGRSA